jgi:hypothetical protein
MFDSRYVYTDATTDILSITHQLAQGDAGSKTGNATLFVVKLPISVPTTVYS